MFSFSGLGKGWLGESMNESAQIMLKLRENTLGQKTHSKKRSFKTRRRKKGKNHESLTTITTGMVAPEEPGHPSGEKVPEWDSRGELEEKAPEGQ